jgi:cytoskeletal protein CcmA (bactofilin family)
MRLSTNHDGHIGRQSNRPGTASDLNNPKLGSRSVFDCSARLTGDLWSEGDVQIDGHLCGNISCVQLIVSKDAVVTGVIVAQEAVIRGKTSGIIRATRVLLQETARVESELIYKSLVVDEGASFVGTARPSANPLAEDFALSSLPEALLSVGQPYTPDTTGANWIGAGCEAPGQAGTLATSEARRQLAPPTVDAQHP